MDCFCGKVCGEEDSPSCHPVFPAIPHDGQGGDGCFAGISTCGGGKGVSGICVCWELLTGKVKKALYMKKILYHGSENIIEQPDYRKGAKTNDYGRGFYCTEEIELAKEWACAFGGSSDILAEWEYCGGGNLPAKTF